MREKAKHNGRRGEGEERGERNILWSALLSLPDSFLKVRNIVHVSVVQRFHNTLLKAYNESNRLYYRHSELLKKNMEQL